MSAIKNTFNAAADTATNVLTTTNKSIGMLTRLVDDASERQTVRSKMDMVIFKATIHQNKSKELADSRLEVNEYISKSDLHNTMFQKAFSELGECLN